MDAEMMNTLIYVVLAVSVLNMVVGLIGPRRQKHIKDRPIDVSGAVIKRLRSASKANRASIPARELWMGGESDHARYKYGKITGIYSGLYCDIIVVKPRVFSWPRVVFVPRELIKRRLGKALIIQANGFQPYGVIYRPVWTADTTAKAAVRYRELILTEWQAIIRDATLFETIEQQAHVPADAMAIGRPDEIFLQREMAAMETREERILQGREAEGSS